MMFAMLVCREAKMATGLAGYRIPEIAKKVREIASDRSRGSLIRQ